MSAPQTPEDKLLCELRRQAGDTPERARFKPMEWAAISRKLGLIDVHLNRAMYALKARGYIEFTPATTEIIALTSTGIAFADSLIKQSQSPHVDDPIPETLQEVTKEMAYWEQRQFEGQPKSDWWEQVDARLRSLRQRELRLTGPSSVSINNNLIGPNTRVNIGSTDRSVNLAGASVDELFAKLREAIESISYDPERERGILNKVQELEDSKGSPTWADRYTQFIGAVADHITVLQPILSAILSKMIGP